MTIKQRLIAAHRAKDWELAKLLSQEREKGKRVLMKCVDCGVTIHRRSKNNIPQRCMMHSKIYRYYKRAIALGSASMLLIVSAWGQNMTLAWSYYTNTPSITFKVYYGMTTNFSQYIEVGTNIESTVTGLTVGQQYYFAVAPVSNGTEGPMTPPILGMVIRNQTEKAVSRATYLRAKNVIIP